MVAAHLTSRIAPILFSKEQPMEELLKNIIEKTGLNMEQAKTAMTNVLGFIRSKIPQANQAQFDTALSNMGQKVNLPTNVTDLSAVAEKTGLQTGQVTSLMETVLTFLKDKLPADLVNQITGALTKGGIAGVVQKVAGMFGGKS